MGNLTKAEEAVKNLTDFINSATSKDVKDFSQAMMSEHRTLQEDTFKLFLETCKNWAEHADKGTYDARNAFTVNKSKDIVDNL